MTSARLWMLLVQVAPCYWESPRAARWSNFSLLPIQKG